MNEATMISLLTDIVEQLKQVNAQLAQLLKK
jgi:hypothetical protein